MSLRTSANAVIVLNESMKGGEVRHRERLVAESYGPLGIDPK